MFNIGGAEFLVIALIALIVLGPDKLPEAARKAGNIAAELRRMSTGFRREIEDAMHDPAEAAARERGKQLIARENEAKAEAPEPDAAAGEGGSE
jgi:sec-independent protein translocase protein TatB